MVAGLSVPTPSPSLVHYVRARRVRVADRHTHGVLRAPPVALSLCSLSSRASVVARVGCRDELFGLTRAWMASSSVGRCAAPPPDRLDVFYKLVDKKVIAGVLCRYARAVDLAATAATQAEALFIDDSLVVARLRMGGSIELTSLACDVSGADGRAFVRQAWALLLSTIAVLLRRLESNTLLRGTIRCGDDREA